ncbi:MAG: hypothetical protein K2J08_02610 [Ruminococcus sp.]|nr:hypothetical protein [Ruminococcus sp.]
MKNLRKRIFALVAVTCVAFVSFAGCSDKDPDDTNTSAETSEEPVKVVPFKVGGGDEEDDDGITMDGVKINEDDPVKADHEDQTKPADKDEESSENESGDGENKSEKTTKNGYTAGQPVTEVVPVTEAGGQQVTEAGGQPVTEVRTVADSNNNSNSNNNNSNSGNNNTANNNETSNNIKGEDYVSNTKGKYAMWIDISKDENYVFNDSFIKVEFKVKDDAPEGIYDIAIEPDLSTIDAKIIVPTIMNGSIKVGDVKADSVDTASMTDFTIYGDKVSAKPGETVDFCINMKNNSGIAAFVVWFYYDSNALVIVNCYPAGEFAKISSNNAQIGDNE